VLCRSSAAAGVPERGRARGWVIVGSRDYGDVVVTLGRTGVWGASCGVLCGVGGLLDLRSEFREEQGRSVA
jgi:hypothetical protein